MRILRVIVKQTAKTLLAPEECAIIAEAVRNRGSGASPWPTPWANPIVHKDAYISNHTVEYFIRYGRVDVLNHIQQKRDIYIPARRAAKWGQIRVVIWACKNHHPLHANACEAAAEHGHLLILKYLMKHEYPWTVLTTENAAKNGHLPVLKWAYAKNYHISPVVFVNAAERGHFHIMEWIARKLHRHFLLSKAGASTAAINGRLDVLKWLFKRGYDLGEITCRIAANNDIKHIVAWLNTIKCPCGRKWH